MTISYTKEVASVTGFGCFIKLLARWKASIYQLIWPEFCLYCAVYYGISFIFVYVMDDKQREDFESVSIHLLEYTDYVPVSFVVGFYVTMVVSRWWDIITKIPYPDNLAIAVNVFIDGEDERARMIRRTIMRYVNLSVAMTFQSTNTEVKIRFPKVEHFVRAGVLEPWELEKMTWKNLGYPMYFEPLLWSCRLVKMAKEEGRIKDEYSYNLLIQEIINIRKDLGSLYLFDWIPIPLVYTQVVTIVVYFSFLLSVFSHQYLDPDKSGVGYFIDLYLPFFHSVQVFIYMGWLKVAETLINPFGADDDDFEANSVIDRNFTVSFYIVDQRITPPLKKDYFWNDEVKLPYTEGSRPPDLMQQQGSTATMEVTPEQAVVITPTRPVVVEPSAIFADGDVAIHGQQRHPGEMRPQHETSIYTIDDTVRP